MNFSETILPGSYVIDVKPFNDERGSFTRYFCKDEFKVIGHDMEWVQLNHSFNQKKGLLRGLHFQLPPYREIKMVKCISGRIFDVIVDLRKNSPRFLSWFGLELSAENKKMLYIPEGFAHGFQCLEDNCELIYHHTEYYQPGFESGIRYNDPKIGIAWPLSVSVISDRDLGHELLDH